MFSCNPSLPNSDCSLKLLDNSHAKEFHVLTNNRAIADIISFLSYPVSRNVIDEWITKNKGDTDRSYGIFSSEGKLLGQISAHTSSANEMEIGYWIGTAFWGKGIASKALKTLSNSLAALNPKCVLFAECLPENLASMRVLEKSGYSKTNLTGHRTGRVRLISNRQL